MAHNDIFPVICAGIFVLKQVRKLQKPFITTCTIYFIINFWKKICMKIKRGKTFKVNLNMSG